MAERSFTSFWARMTLVGLVALPIVAVGFGFVATDDMPIAAPLAAIAIGAGLTALLWGRHGRIVCNERSLTEYNWGLSRTLAYDEIDGFVWRAPPTITPLGVGVVFVKLDEFGPGGVRGLAPVATASYLLDPERERHLEALLFSSVPGLRKFRTPDVWRRPNSTLAPDRDGGEEIAPP